MVTKFYFTKKKEMRKNSPFDHLYKTEGKILAFSSDLKIPQNRENKIWQL
jgi:hypothetical protein